MKVRFPEARHRQVRALLGGLLISTGLLFGTPHTAKAQIHGEADTNSFRQIEQPLGIKLGLTAAGVGLIGLEFWWFLLSKNKAQTAQAAKGVQSIDITVDGGYSPDQIVVQAGQPVRLNFLRKDASSCLEKIILPEFNKALDLPLNKDASIEVFPEKTGRYTFHCGMNMFRGTITAK